MPTFVSPGYDYFERDLSDYDADIDRLPTEKEIDRAFRWVPVGHKGDRYVHGNVTLLHDGHQWTRYMPYDQLSLFAGIEIN